MASKGAPIENRILASLPRDEYRRLLPLLRHVTLEAAQVLYVGCQRGQSIGIFSE